MFSSFDTNRTVDLEWIWRCDTLPKINFFLWLVIQGRLPKNVWKKHGSFWGLQLVSLLNNDALHILRTASRQERYGISFHFTPPYSLCPLAPGLNKTSHTLPNLPVMEYFSPMYPLGTLAKKKPIFQETLKPPEVRWKAFNWAWGYFSSKLKTQPFFPQNTDQKWQHLPPPPPDWIKLIVMSHSQGI